MRADGRCSYVSKNAPLAVASVDAYNALVKEGNPYAFMTTEDILSLTNKKNPDVTWKTIDDFGGKLTTQYILEKFK